MSVSYNGLWKLLIDKNMKKVNLINDLGISSSTIAKMTKGEKVSMNILKNLVCLRRPGWTFRGKLPQSCTR